ncbi:MAG: HAMP domain-containing histidine kinase [Geobacteraceae bacterium]|nr:HAMP domain-containing histidine kinase [Geobacteraceae bacterium]
MHCSLRCKLLILLLTVMAVALSAAVVLRSFIIHDFKNYSDGESQDRVQRVIAQLEGNYDLHGAWKRDALAVELAWALQMGIDARILDTAGNVLLDTREAINSLKPLMRKRVLEVSGYDPSASDSEFVSHPLFLKGVEIGRLDARLLNPLKDDYFISSSNRFLAVSVAILGIIALILSIVASRRLARPVLELSAAAGDIAAGDLSRRVVVPGQDEIGKLADSFNRMAESLESQEKLRRRLLAGAAHELRTPLAIISGELEGMIDGVLPTSRQGLQSMHDEAVRLTTILNGLDDLTRAESSVLSLQRELFELKPFLSAICGRLERLFAEKGAILILECPDDLVLFADPDRMSQIVINLMTNALRAITAGGRVTIDASVRNDAVCLEIADTGAGIAEEDIAHIFERFFKGAGGGLGLGLAIVKELVTAHGGNISVKSRPGEGTSFLIVIPHPV